MAKIPSRKYYVTNSNRIKFIIIPIQESNSFLVPELLHTFLIYNIHDNTRRLSGGYHVCLSFHPIVLRAFNEKMNRIPHKGSRARYCFAFPYNIRRVLVDGITSTGMVSAPAAIRNAICGVFAVQKITAASFNEPCTRDLGSAR